MLAVEGLLLMVLLAGISLVIISCPHYKPFWQAHGTFISEISAIHHASKPIICGFPNQPSL